MAGQESPDTQKISTTREDLERENAELRASVAFLNKKLQLVGSITRHDVLNQLTAVVGYNELLGMMVQDEKLKGFLEKEKMAIGKIRRQFQFAKDYQNIGTEAPSWQSIRGCVARILEDVDLGGMKVVTETGTASVLADPLFEKVLLHIFENAGRHGKTATEIRVTITECGSGAILVVENNGAGIPQGDKTRIFERGFGQGTGWGLFLAREILAITGMTITETGDPAGGTRFEIAIPPGFYRMA